MVLEESNSRKWLGAFSHCGITVISTRVFKVEGKGEKHVTDIPLPKYFW
jgi:hypothetical protein